MKEPKTFFVGETCALMDGVRAYLEYTQQEAFLVDWDDAGQVDNLTDAERLVSMFAKLCYKSLVPGKNKNVTKTRGISDNLESVIKSGHGSVFEHVWFNFITTDCSRILTHELVRHRVGTAFCLAGDVEVWSGSKVNGMWDGVRNKWTMQQLWEYSQDWRRKGRLKLMRVRCLDKDKFVSVPIKDVYQSGIKDIVRVELENGRSIRCSADHRFLCRRGWRSIRGLRVGNELVVNGMVRGMAATEEAELERRGKISRAMTGARNHRWCGDDVGPGGAYRRARKFVGDECDHCGSDYQLSIHHIDRNILNNSPENLLTLCNPCHGRLHSREDGNPNALVPRWSRIVSIVPDGREMTYDLEVDHPSHNFVANGIVTHNSQTSGRYVAIDDELDLVFPKQHTDNPVVTAQLQSIRLAVIEAARILREELIPEDADFATKKKLTSAIRRIAPNGQSNEIAWSCNLRSVRHMIEMRTSRHAEWEIRLVFNQVADLLDERYPTLLMGPDVDVELVDGLNEYRGLRI